jgi:toxin YoeB
MKRTFTDEGWDDYQYWQETNKKQIKRINQLIEDIDRHPFTGIGKPEPLKGNLSGYWSRRIDSEHRLVYPWTKSPSPIFRSATITQSKTTKGFGNYRGARPIYEGVVFWGFAF